jgi:hypothetical protein
VLNPSGGYLKKDGLSANWAVEMDGSATYQNCLWRNAWQAETINPHGTGLAIGPVPSAMKPAITSTPARSRLTAI